MTSGCCGRRQVLGATGVAASAVLLGACSSAGQRASDAADLNREAASAAAAAAEAPLATTEAVPVGGGIIVEAAETVITQPVEGEFMAFSSICPHQGCAVERIEDGQIVCPCHDSHFDIATGDVLSGPARRGLTVKTVSVDGDGIVVS